MKAALIFFVSFAMFTACAKKAAKFLSDDEYRKLAQPGPAAGRADFVSSTELQSDPAKYSGRRVVLAGIWSGGFEHSLLHLEGPTQKFWIWVDADWTKIEGPAGDFTGGKEKRKSAKPDHNAHVSYQILAEGTFYYRAPHLTDGGPPGFGHMSVSPGYFLLDRLFQFDPVEEEPNQSLQPTAPSGRG